MISDQKEIKEQEKFEVLLHGRVKRGPVQVWEPGDAVRYGSGALGENGVVETMSWEQDGVFFGSFMVRVRLLNSKREVIYTHAHNLFRRGDGLKRERRTRKRTPDGLRGGSAGERVSAVREG